MGTPPPASPLAALRARLPALMARDEHRLRRRVDGARGMRDVQALHAVADKIAADIEDAERRVERRRAAVPTPRYPSELPVSQKRDEILAAIRDHQVVVVAGETGSGKTTQLPKICLELGRGVLGQIGHTQPRRLAARTVAERVAEELGTPLGEAVGYKVRFTDRSGDDTLVKLMTDGILLAEIQRDRMLRQYDTLIIDEAHERSLTIDFILGYVKQLLPRRPDLKIVITSATIDPARFARHFGDAPVIEVSGRTYPVEVRYRPLVDEGGDEAADDDTGGDAGGLTGGLTGGDPEEERDQIQAICDAVDELCAEGPGDILVFLSGEREIRDTADALARQGRPLTEVVPLYARLSAAEQHRVFEPHTGRRIVLATNVAETSLTVPGITYVVDPGTARISRYSRRTKVQRLPIEPISRASADQRKGRCGRTAAGICVRLYSEADFLARPEFTDPEILRTNLASVILQMAALGLGDIAAFPFLDPPDRRNLKDGTDLLHELGALEPGGPAGASKLTPVGRRLAQLPLDPRLARMVLEADANGCAREVLVVVAALAIQDPRERPADKQEAAAQMHARFTDRDGGSDFLAYLRLWDYVREKQEELTGNQFRRLCRTEFLNYLRIREWQDVHGQLRQIARTLGINTGGINTGEINTGEINTGGITPNESPADARRIHTALLAGLLSHLGMKDGEKREYLGARGARFALVPGSAGFRRQPRWIMVGELVETSRLWGRIGAPIEPEWAERLAGHLVKRSYSEPHWEKKRAAVMAYERVTLYGLPIVTARKTDYGRIDPEAARELFIRNALVEGDWDTHHAFFRANRGLLDEVEDLENRARRRGLLDEEALFAYYDERVGSEVVSGRHFDAWWKKARAADPDLLTYQKSLLFGDDAPLVDEDAYPDEWDAPGIRLALSYRFEPGAPDDGVTVHVPLPVLHELDADDFAWQIPGLRRELVTALIRSLPKAVRRHFAPVPDHAAAALRGMTPRQEPLPVALADRLRRMTGVVVEREDWQLERVPDHLRMTFRVEDKAGAVLAEGKDLAALKRRLSPRIRTVVSAAARGVERSGLRAWEIGTLPKLFDGTRDGHAVRAFPALVDEGESVAVRTFPTEAEQRAAMALGTRRLLRLTVPSPLAAVQRRLSNEDKLALSRHPYSGTAALFEDCLACASDRLVDDAGGPAWDDAAFARLRESVQQHAFDATSDVVAQVVRVLTAHHAATGRLTGTSNLALLPALTDMRAQVADLVYDGFVSATGAARLPDLVRYLHAVEARAEKLPRDPRRDRDRQVQLDDVRAAYERLLDAVRPESAGTENAGTEDARTEDVRRIRWMIEELRVSYFAQTLGTPYPVSDKRILRAIDQLTP